MKELYTTGVPLPFECQFVCKVKKTDCAKIEKALHTAFGPQRINANREFFRIQVEQAKAILEQLDSMDIRELERVFWQELGTKEDYDRFSANALYGGNIAAFIRSMTHVDYSVAIQKFQDLIQVEELTSTQMEYLRSIIAYVSQYGDIETQKISQTEPFRHFDWIGAFGDKASHVVSYISNLHNVIVA